MLRTSSAARGMSWLALGMFLTCSAATIYAGKDVFIRSKPHVNVGSVAGVEMEIWLHANVQIDADEGSASGVIHLRLETGERLMYQAVTAELIDGGQGEIHLTVKPLHGSGGSEDEFDLVLVRPDSAINDCLIYDFVGPNVHVEAPGEITFRQLNSR